MRKGRERGAGGGGGGEGEGGGRFTHSVVTLAEWEDEYSVKVQ